MKINELLSEQQLDELNLQGLGTGLGKVVGAPVGAAVQGAKNVWSGMKQGYGAGKQALAPGQKPTPNQGIPAKPQGTSGSTTLGATQTVGSNQAAPGASTPPSAGTVTTPTPQAAAGQAPVTPAQVQAANAQQTNTDASELPGDSDPTRSFTPGAAGGTAPTTVQPSAVQQQRVGVPAGKKAVDQAVNVIKTVRGDRRPQVVKYAQDQLAGVHESTEFYSKFLGKNI